MDKIKLMVLLLLLLTAAFADNLPVSLPPLVSL